MSFFNKLFSFFTSSVEPPKQQNSNNQTINRPSTSNTIISNEIDITIILINSQEKNVKLRKNMTGGELKQYIYQSLSQQLDSQSMSIYYEGVKITKNMKLENINLVVGTKIIVRQTKADVADVVSNIADANGIDPLTDEVGTAKMICGHHIGRDSMIALIRSLIEANKYEIRCPNLSQDDQPCLAVWDFAICRKIGVFTKTEVTEFEDKLSENWLKQFSKSCPNCKFSISKYMLNTNRVSCPKCKYSDFCYLCLNKWKGSSLNSYCGNEQCKFLNEFVSKSPWDKKFRLIDKADGNQRKQYTTPKYRACVHCMAIIEHGQACKHMQCRSCKKSFCWVCLGVPQNGNYPCGKFNEYCGKVAQVQKMAYKTS